MPVRHDLPERAGARFRWLNRLGRHELPLLLAMLGLAGGTWAFVEVADEVIEGETHATDQRLLLALRSPADPREPLGPGWLEEMGRDFTALGGVGVLTLIGIGALIYLLLASKYRTALFTAVALTGGWLLSAVLKMGFDRPRPDLVPHGSIVYTASFPSGHAMMAAVTYLTLAAMLARVQPRRRLKAYLLLAAIALTVLVGISRIYLGVHWPSDVLAGWTAGAAWASLCWLTARWLQRRGRIEGEHGDMDI
jgi:undecaprenyl-diphosphatase